MYSDFNLFRNNQVEESMQIKQQLSEAQKTLQDMIKVLELDSDTTSTFSIVSRDPLL